MNQIQMLRNAANLLVLDNPINDVTFYPIKTAISLLNDHLTTSRVFFVIQSVVSAVVFPFYTLATIFVGIYTMHEQPNLQMLINTVCANSLHAMMISSGILAACMPSREAQLMSQMISPIFANRH